MYCDIEPPSSLLLLLLLRRLLFAFILLPQLQPIQKRLSWVMKMMMKMQATRQLLQMAQRLNLSCRQRQCLQECLGHLQDRLRAGSSSRASSSLGRWSASRSGEWSNGLWG